jgi:hypothetical protein
VLGRIDFRFVPNLKMLEKWLETFLLNAKCHGVPSSPDIIVNLFDNNYMTRKKAYGA